MNRISRRRLIQVGGAAMIAGALPRGALANEVGSIADRTYRIHMILGRGEGANEAGFRDHLMRRGLNVEYTVHNTAGDLARLPGILREVKEARPDLIYTWGTPQTLAVVGRWDHASPNEIYVRDIPVVFTFVAAPVVAGVVPQLDRPGGNVTGTIHIAPVNAQVNAILAFRPFTRIGVVYNPAEPNSVAAVDELRAECWQRGIELIEAPAPLRDNQPHSSDIPDLLADCHDRGAEILYIGPDTFLASVNRALVATTALELGLPTFSVTELIVRADGALFALSSSAYGIGRLTAVKAIQILVDGVLPGDIPVETLRRFSVVINMATAHRLTSYPPLDLLNLAEVVGI